MGARPRNYRRPGRRHRRGTSCVLPVPRASQDPLGLASHPTPPPPTRTPPPSPPARTTTATPPARTPPPPPPALTPSTPSPPSPSPRPAVPVGTTWPDRLRRVDPGPPPYHQEYDPAQPAIPRRDPRCLPPRPVHRQTVVLNGTIVVVSVREARPHPVCRIVPWDRRTEALSLRVSIPVEKLTGLDLRRVASTKYLE